MSQDVEGWRTHRTIENAMLACADGIRDLEQKYAGWGDWSILQAFRGSIAHGTYEPPENPDSIDDKDLIGICVPPIEYYFGLKDYASKGTQEIKQGDLDVVIYEARKAIRLLAKGNPNMLCLLWMPDNMYLKVTDAGRQLLEFRAFFSTKAAFQPFMGYGMSQYKKMEKGGFHGFMGEKRKRLVEKHGYDCKSASHLIRLLRQGQEFMRTGEMQVMRDDRDELLAIKHGEWSLEQVKREAAREIAFLEYEHGRSKLPKEPNMDDINWLAVRVVEAGVGSHQ